MGIFTSKSKFPRLMLFDVEGTLIKSKHPRFLPLVDSLELQFGKLQTSDSIFTDWKTDFATARDLLTYNSIEVEASVEEKIALCIRDMPELLSNGVENGKYEFEMVPNVDYVLRSLASRCDIRLGLLSTDAMPVTGMKLDIAHINTPIFEGLFKRGIVKPVGAFGADADTKIDLLPVAINQYVEFLDRDLSEIAPYDVIVVGNDMSDVEAARLSGVPVVAVGHEPELDDAADWLLPDFLDLGVSVAKIIVTGIKDDYQPKPWPPVPLDQLDSGGFEQEQLPNSEDIQKLKSNTS